MSESQNSKKSGCSSFLAILTCSSTRNSTQRQIQLNQDRSLSDTLTGNNQIQPAGSQNQGRQIRVSGRPLVQIRAGLPPPLLSQRQDNNNFQIPPVELLPPKPVKVSNIIIETVKKLEDIKVCDYLPLERDLRYQFKYYCPICLRYFNSMLLSQCCYNYLCHYCSDEIVEREKNVESYIASCPYKCEGKFILHDVNPNSQIKRYSDSQYMSFYSNIQGGKITAGACGSASNGFNKSKAFKENKSPEKMGMNTTTNQYDPFGDKDYKATYFQNSAQQFMRRTQRLDVESAHGRNEARETLTLEDGEESKSGMNSHANGQIINRSDAFHAAYYARRPPLQQIRQNIVKQANKPDQSDGFSKQNSLPRNNRSIQFDDEGNYNDIYDLHRNTLQSPDVPPNFAPGNADFALSPLYMLPAQGLHPNAYSLGSSLVGETFGHQDGLYGDLNPQNHHQNNLLPPINGRRINNKLPSAQNFNAGHREQAIVSQGFIMEHYEDAEDEQLRIESAQNKRHQQQIQSANASSSDQFIGGDRDESRSSRALNIHNQEEEDDDLERDLGN